MLSIRSKLSKAMPLIFIRNNRKVWEDINVIMSYIRLLELQKPEKVIFEKLKRDGILQNAAMLDIGVGLGRTTFYVAPLVKDYVAIDYSKNMIKVCKVISQHKFSFFVPLLLSDAGFMPFRKETFDVVLFSYNGLDYSSPYKRIEILKEIRRVIKKHGFFIFSSHNLHSLGTLFKTCEACSFLYRVKRHTLLLLLNRRILKDKKLRLRDFALIYDGSGNWGLKTYYVNPIKQIEQLLQCNFQNIRVFGLDGKEIKSVELEKRSDPWLYYFCEAV